MPLLAMGEALAHDGAQGVSNWMLDAGEATP